MLNIVSGDRVSASILGPRVTGGGGVSVGGRGSVRDTVILKPENNN